MRCIHEAQMHPENSFITLTYSDDHLPEDYSIQLRTFQLFMKRLRETLGSKKIRFYGCGEYGEETLRPHYHAIIFGHDFPDKKHYSTNDNGDRVYTSETLDKIWGFGECKTGDVTYQSAGYVARYCMKKITGDQAASHYLRIHPKTQLLTSVEPEFAVQSRRDGLGTSWFNKFKNDCFPSDFLVVDGKHHRVPAFYLKKLAEEELTRTKRRRKANSLPRKADNTKTRLAVREEIKKSRINRLKRTL